MSKSIFWLYLKSKIGKMLKFVSMNSKADKKKKNPIHNMDFDEVMKRIVRVAPSQGEELKKAEKGKKPKKK